MKLTWIGHSCFKLEEKDYTIIFDPYGDDTVPGLKPMREKADLVLCSHGHRDHSAEEVVEIIDGRKNPFTITEILTFHDDEHGELHGNNVVHVLDDGNFKIVHFGDIGCDLTDNEIQILSDADVVMIPVGGYFTVDAQGANRILAQIDSKIVIPMHYRGNGFGFDVIDTVDAFLKLCSQSVKTDRSSVQIHNRMEKQTIVLVPQNCF